MMLFFFNLVACFPINNYYQFSKPSLLSTHNIAVTIEKVRKHGRGRGIVAYPNGIPVRVCEFHSTQHLSNFDYSRVWGLSMIKPGNQSIINKSVKFFYVLYFPSIDNKRINGGREIQVKFSDYSSLI